MECKTAMLEKDLKNLSLQMKIQEQLARPLFSGIRRAAVSTDFIARLKAEQLDTPLIPSLAHRK